MKKKKQRRTESNETNLLRDWKYGVVSVCFRLFFLGLSISGRNSYHITAC